MLETASKLFLTIFAVYRLAQLFALDIGPYRVFEKMRIYLGIRAARETGWHWHTLADAINCPFCLGLWFSILLVPIAFFGMPFLEILLLILGVAGAQCFLQEKSAHNER